MKYVYRTLVFMTVTSLAIVAAAAVALVMGAKKLIKHLRSN